MLKQRYAIKDVYLLCDIDACVAGRCDIRIPCKGFCVFCDPDNDDVYRKECPL